MRDNEKQIVSKEIILKEIAIKEKMHMKTQLRIFVLFLLFLAVLVFGLFIHLDYSQNFSRLLIIGSAALCIICMIAHIKQWLYYFNADNYELSIEKATEKIKMPSRFTYFEYTHRIYFKTKVCVYPGICSLELDADTVLRETNVGDTFFVVGKGKKAYCIFNTKYFELEEELEKELRN